MAPLHKRALGTAVGLTLGSLIFIATGYSVLRGAPPAQLELLAIYFPGYSVSWAGALVGFGWGGFMFFVGGWFCAFLRNFTIGASLWMARTLAELDASRDFLDHI